MNLQKPKDDRFTYPLPIWFLVGFCLWASFLGTLLALTNKGVAERWINHHWSPAADVFFYYLTYLGDGLFAFPFLVLWFVLKSKREALVITFSLLLASIFVQASKRILFTSMPRPAAFFEQQSDLHFVSGLELHRMSSFPSGHSMQIFVMLFAMALLYQTKVQQLALLTLAALVAFSRVYLLQHFLIDILVGSALGILCTLATLWALRKTPILTSLYWQQAWLSRK